MTSELLAAGHWLLAKAFGTWYLVLWCFALNGTAHCRRKVPNTKYQRPKSPGQQPEASSQQLSVLRLRPCVVFHFGGPAQKSSELSAFAEQEAPEFEEADLIHFQAGVGFHAPAQIGAAPGRQMVASRCVPKKSKYQPHILSVIDSVLKSVGCRTKSGRPPKTTIIAPSICSAKTSMNRLPSNTGRPSLLIPRPPTPCTAWCASIRNWKGSTTPFPWPK